MLIGHVSLAKISLCEVSNIGNYSYNGKIEVGPNSA